MEMPIISLITRHGESMEHKLELELEPASNLDGSDRMASLRFAPTGRELGLYSTSTVSTRMSRNAPKMYKYRKPVFVFYVLKDLGKVQYMANRRSVQNVDNCNRCEWY